MAPTAPLAALQATPASGSSTMSLATWVIREGGLPEEKVLAAVARQVVYGGSLDTALLELEVLGVEDLWALLSAATGLAIPAVGLLAPKTWEDRPLSPEASALCRAVPATHREDGVLQLLCAEPVALDELHRLATRIGTTFELFIAPEVHVEALRSALYGRPMSARLAKLWMRLVGRSGLRTRPVARQRASAAPGALPGTFGDADGLNDASPLSETNKAPQEVAAAPESPTPSHEQPRATETPPRAPAAGTTRTKRAAKAKDARRAPPLDGEPTANAGATPLQAVIALEDVTNPGWAPDDDEPGAATEPSEIQPPREEEGPAQSASPTAASESPPPPPETAPLSTTTLPPPPPRQSGERPRVEAATQTESFEDGSAGFASARSTLPGYPAPDFGAQDYATPEDVARDRDLTPEAPYALTLDFEADPPLTDEPTADDEARASAVAWETFSATEALCRRARDIQDPGRTLALRALRRRLNMPPVPSFRRHLVALLDGEGPAGSMRALADLTEMRDREAVPAIVPLLEASDRKLATAARQALMLLTLQDFGSKKRKWEGWWETNRSIPATDWLFEGLSHKDAPLRLAAAEELRQITGAYFGYHFDLPKRDREDAKRRWYAWWQSMTAHEHEEGGG